MYIYKFVKKCRSVPHKSLTLGSGHDTVNPPNNERDYVRAAAIRPKVDPLLFCDIKLMFTELHRTIFFP